MDRIQNADDNAERLFEFTSRERPDINAWFVIEAGTPDWKRLQRGGRARLVAYGSFRWTMLMLNARWLLSSHADTAITDPPRLKRLVKQPTGRWRASSSTA